MGDSDHWSRRRVLSAGIYTTGIYAAGVAAALGASSAPAPRIARRVTLHNPHTLESVDVLCVQNGGYDEKSLRRCQALLRDLRTGEQQPIDPRLFDDLHDVAERLGVDPTFSVISGYRSASADGEGEPRGGAARGSLHSQGRALDVRLAGVASADLAGAALGMARGGIGFYRRADFVHLDTGVFRSWRG